VIITLGIFFFLFDRIDSLIIQSVAALEKKKTTLVNFKTKYNLNDKVSTLIFIAVCTILLTNLYINQQRGLEFAKEDGLLENTTVIFYIFAFFSTCRLAYDQKKTMLLRWWLLFFALLFFVTAGEEISWGQRIFNIATPTGLKRINVQGELSMHNIYSTSITQYFALCFVSIIFIVLPLANTISKKIKRILLAFEFPVLNMRFVFLSLISALMYILIGLRLGNLGIGPFTKYGIAPHLDDEYLEFFISGLSLLSALSDWGIICSFRKKANRTIS